MLPIKFIIDEVLHKLKAYIGIGFLRLVIHDVLVNLAGLTGEISVAEGSGYKANDPPHYTQSDSVGNFNSKARLTDDVDGEVPIVANASDAHIDCNDQGQCSEVSDSLRDGGMSVKQEECVPQQKNHHDAKSTRGGGGVS